jgi:hypothetical protein
MDPDIILTHGSLPMSRQIRYSVLFIVLCALVALPAIAQQTGAWVQPDMRQCDAALQYLADHQPAGDRFTFCAIADTQTSKPAVPKEITRRAVGEIELLDPAFVIASGDMIRGYTGDAELVNEEWDAHLQLTNALAMPWVPVPGNHDIWGWDSREIYQDRIGPTAFSFDYGNAHFIALDTEEPLHMAALSPAQIAWLEADLEAHGDAAHIFMFMHKPAWVPRYQSNFVGKILPLIKEYPVRAIFAGHEHLYRVDSIEGTDCKFFVIGGGGGNLLVGPKLGGFHHFMHVSVDGDEITYAVIKPGGIEAISVMPGMQLKAE